MCENAFIVIKGDDEIRIYFVVWVLFLPCIHQIMEKILHNSWPSVCKGAETGLEQRVRIMNDFLHQKSDWERSII